MEEYISREALLSDIDAAMDNAGMGYVIGQTLKRYVKRQPTANVVPVVRCRYCKHHHWEQEPCHGKTVHICDLLRAEVDRDFFCAAGERSVQLDA